MKHYFGGVPGGSQLHDRERRIYQPGVQNRLVTFAYPVQAEIALDVRKEIQDKQESSNESES